MPIEGKGHGLPSAHISWWGTRQTTRKWWLKILVKVNHLHVTEMIPGILFPQYCTTVVPENGLSVRTKFRFAVWCAKSFYHHPIVLGRLLLRHLDFHWWLNADLFDWHSGDPNQVDLEGLEVGSWTLRYTPSRNKSKVEGFCFSRACRLQLLQSHHCCSHVFWHFWPVQHLFRCLLSSTSTAHCNGVLVNYIRGWILPYTAMHEALPHLDQTVFVLNLDR